MIESRDKIFERSMETFVKSLDDTEKTRQMMKMATAIVPEYYALKRFVERRGDYVFGRDARFSFQFLDDGTVGFSLDAFVEDGNFRRKYVLVHFHEPISITPELLKACAKCLGADLSVDPLVKRLVKLRFAWYEKLRDEEAAKKAEAAAAKAIAQKNSKLRSKYRELYELFEGQDPSTMAPDAVPTNG